MMTPFYKLSSLCITKQPECKQTIYNMLYDEQLNVPNVFRRSSHKRDKFTLTLFSTVPTPQVDEDTPHSLIKLNSGHEFIIFSFCPELDLLIIVYHTT